MSLESKLARWQQAGLIDGETRARIEDFERKGQRPVLLYALGGLGALTIGIGIVSIVAANWDAISRGVKVGADLLIGAALAAAVYRVASQERRWPTDVLAGVHYAFVLASLALIGQVYQLGSPTHHALLAWSLSTAPLMLLVRSRLLGLVWLAGLVWTHAETTIFYLERMHERHGYDDALLGNVASLVVFASAMAYVGLSRLPWFVRERPQVSAVWSHALWVSIVLAGCALCFVFYERIYGNDTLSWAVLACGLVVGVWLALLPRWYPAWSARTVLGTRLLLLLIWLVLAAGTSVAHDEVPAVGAIAQVAILSLSAWTVLQGGQVRTFNALTGVIALRILGMYFEVFGSMLSTGLGMITGGALTLLLAWVWKRKSPELATRLTAGADHAA